MVEKDLIPIVVVGPTASGKSALSLELAHHFDGEVVNCDSMQLYRGMDIGTAKLSVEERREYRTISLMFGRLSIRHRWRVTKKTLCGM